MLSLALVVACDRRGVIGRDGKMPWHMPADLQYFRRLTWGRPILMGRQTWQAIGSRPLPGRPNIVLSRCRDVSLDGAHHAVDVATALALAAHLPCTEPCRMAESAAIDLFVIGGASVYRQLLPQTQWLYRTEIDAECVGDRYFPAYKTEEWQEMHRRHQVADDNNPYGCHFVCLQRVKDADCGSDQRGMPAAPGTDRQLGKGQKRAP